MQSFCILSFLGKQTELHPNLYNLGHWSCPLSMALENNTVEPPISQYPCVQQKCPLRRCDSLWEGKLWLGLSLCACLQKVSTVKYLLLLEDSHCTEGKHEAKPKH